VLTPGRYVGAAEANDKDEEPIAEKIDRLTKELFAHFDESARLEQIVRDQLERLDV
jgi:type I restriction enzyme M protein